MKATCDGDDTLMTGGCKSNNNRWYITESRPSGKGSWTCGFTGDSGSA